MNVVDPIPLAIGLSVLLFGVVSYARKRMRLARAIRKGEPLSEDGWLTFLHEPEYQQVAAEMQNEAFGRICRVGLVGFFLVASGYGLNLKYDFFSFLMDLQ